MAESPVAAIPRLPVNKGGASEFQTHEKPRKGEIMRRLLSLVCLSAGLVLSMGCCHTCDVCDDCGSCGGCYDSHYGVYGTSSCSSCGGYAQATKPAPAGTQIAAPVHSTVKTR